MFYIYIIFDFAMAVIMLLFGIWFYRSKGQASNFLSGYNMKSAEERKKYDENAMCKAYGKRMMLMSLPFIAGMIIDICPPVLYRASRRVEQLRNLGIVHSLEVIQQYGFALFFRQSTDCFKKQLWRDFLPGFLKDGFGGFTFEIFIKRMKLPRFV